MSLSLVKTRCDACYVHISPITIARAFISPWIKTHPIRGQYNLSAKLSRLSKSVVCITDTNVALPEYRRPVLNVPKSDSFVTGPGSELASAKYARGSSIGPRAPLCSFLFVPLTYVERGIGRE